MIKKKRILVFVILSLFYSLLIINFCFAETIGIDVKNSYYPGEIANIKFTIYDDSQKQIPGVISYSIKDYLTNPIKEGIANSGEAVELQLDTNSEKGLWEIDANYNGIDRKEYFNVLDLEKADIKIIGDNLVLKNIGNIPYKKSLVITIGEEKQTAIVSLEVGQTKTLKLTAPNGNYDIRVSDGTSKEELVFNSISLTGNVIGLESIGKNSFFSNFPLVSLFLICLVLVVIVVFVLKTYFKHKIQDNKVRVNKKKKKK